MIVNLDLIKNLNTRSVSVESKYAKQESMKRRFLLVYKIDKYLITNDQRNTSFQFAREIGNNSNRV